MTGAARPVHGRDPEYDRFGPWVLEITADDPPPPLFEPHLGRGRTPLLAVKVPRKLARRDAHPGMDLYDYMVSLYEEELVVLERVEQGVRERRIAYRDVQYMRIGEELLRGGLALGVPGDRYELPYNTVSNELMGRVAGVIRERYLGTDDAPTDLPAAPHADGLSFYFERLLRKERETEAPATLLLAQPDLALGLLETSALRRVLFGLVDKRLLESVHICDGQELRILDRGRPLAYRWQSTYGRHETMIPLANITGATLTPADDITQTLTLGTAAGEIAWLLGRETDGAAAYAEWLSKLARPTRR